MDLRGPANPYHMTHCVHSLNRMVWYTVVSLCVKSALSMAYHPQTDGTTEQMNQEIEAYLLSSEFRWRYWVRSRVRHWLQLVGCAALLMDASNFGGPDRVGESGVELRRSLRKARAS